jgi:hypothetical protein
VFNCFINIFSCFCIKKTKNSWPNKENKFTFIFVCFIVVFSSGCIYQYHPGDPIRSVDPIVFNRIRVGFHRKPTSFIKNRSDPTWFLSDSYWSESGPNFIGIWRNPMKSGSNLVEFHRVPSNSDEIRAGFRPIGIRQKPCRIRYRLFRSDRIRPPMNLLGRSSSSYESPFCAKSSVNFFKQNKLNPLERKDRLSVYIL